MSNHPRRNWRSALAADAEALGPNLVRAYVALFDLPSAAVAALPGRHDLTRLGQWRRGERPVPARVQRAMRAAVLDHLLGAPSTAVAAVMEPPETGFD